MTEQQQEEVAWWCNAAAAGGRRMAELPPLSWLPAPTRQQGPWLARSPPCASGGSATGGTRARLPQIGRRGPWPPRSPGELACQRQLELEDELTHGPGLAVTGLEDPGRASHGSGFCA